MAKMASVVFRKWLDIFSALFALFPDRPTGLYHLQLLPRPLDLGHYILHGCGPYKGSGCLVPSPKEFLNCLLQLCHADKRCATHRFPRQLAKPPFHLIEPTGTGGYEVQSKSWMTF